MLLATRLCLEGPRALLSLAEWSQLNWCGQLNLELWITGLV